MIVLTPEQNAAICAKAGVKPIGWHIGDALGSVLDTWEKALEWIAALSEGLDSVPVAERPIPVYPDVFTSQGSAALWDALTSHGLTVELTQDAYRKLSKAHVYDWNFARSAVHVADWWDGCDAGQMRAVALAFAAAKVLEVRL